MSQNSTLNLNQDCSSQIFSLKLIIKLPKNYSLGNILLSLVRLANVEVDFLGGLTGIQEDGSNWSYVEMNGTVLDLINANLYLEVLQIDIDIVEIDPESLVHFINYYLRD
jgi:hypothetical protein